MEKQAKNNTMKNLILIPILLPAEDASELAFDREMTKLNYWGRPYMGDGWPQYLYLCSDLRINEGEWCLHLHSKTLCKWDKDCYDQNQYRKIEFTTDPNINIDLFHQDDKLALPMLDGNTKARIMDVERFPKSISIYKEVNFLTEFCNRYNQNVEVENFMKDMPLSIDEQIIENLKRKRGYSLEDMRKAIAETIDLVVNNDEFSFYFSFCLLHFNFG